MILTASNVTLKLSGPERFAFHWTETCLANHGKENWSASPTSLPYLKDGARHQIAHRRRSVLILSCAVFLIQYSDFYEALVFQIHVVKVTCFPPDESGHVELFMVRTLKELSVEPFCLNVYTQVELSSVSMFTQQSRRLEDCATLYYTGTW